MSATVDNADVEVPTNHWVLKSEDDVLRFVDTLSSPPGIERLLSLDRLDIKVSRIDSDVAQKLSVMLDTHGPSMVITELRLTQAESFLNSYVDLGGAFAGLTTLKTLYANNVDEGAAEMLMNMKSQLESAELSLDGDNHWAKRTPDQFYIVNPIVLLRPSQHTLKKLTAFGAETDVAAEVYPEMCELELEFPGPLRTYELVRAFPGLRTLKISTLGGVFWGASQKLRATAQQNGDEQSDGTWDDLHCVTAPLSVVYALALRCHVQVLDMIARSPRDTWDLLSDVLKATCPRVLRLRTTCTRILEHGRSLLSGMRVKPRKPCWYMELFVEVLRSDEEEDVRLALARIKHEMKYAVMFSLTVHIVCAPEDGQTAPTNQGCSYEVAMYLCGLNLKKEVLDLITAIPALTSADVRLVRHPWQADAHAGLSYSCDERVRKDGYFRGIELLLTEDRDDFQVENESSDGEGEI